MNDSDLKKLRELIKEEIRPVKEIVEVIKKKVDNQELHIHVTTENVRSVKEQQSVMNEKLDGVKETQEDHTRRLEALSGDIEQLHMDVKGIRDKEGMTHSRNKREIDEIKKYLDLPILPDAPQV